MQLLAIGPDPLYRVYISSGPGIRNTNTRSQQQVPANTTQHESYYSWVERLGLCLFDDCLTEAVQRDRHYRLSYDALAISSTARLVPNQRQSISQRKRVRIPPPVFIRCAYNKSVVTPIVCQPAELDKWKHLLANVEAVIDTAVTYNPQEAVKVFSLVTQAVKAVRPAHPAKLIYGPRGRHLRNRSKSCNITSDSMFCVNQGE